MILKAVDAEEPLLQLPLGPMAYQIAEKNLASLKQDMEAWRETATATDFS